MRNDDRVGRDAIPKSPVSAIEVMVLTKIASHGQAGVLQATITRELHISPATVTRAVKALCNRRLVTVEPDAADGRHRNVRILDKRMDIV